MPLGIVSDDEFLNEVIEKKEPESEPEINIAQVLDLPSVGRPDGKANTPDFIRNIVGEEKVRGASSKELSNLFNIGPQGPFTYSKGAHSNRTYQDKNPALNQHINSVKERIVKKASNRLSVALTEITPEKLQAASLKDLSVVAKNMSGIIKDMSPEEKVEDNKAQIVIFAPRPNEISSYEMLQLNE